MNWTAFILQMIVPAAVAVYTFNFGRWMHRNHNKTGACGAYALAALSFGLTAWVLMKNNV